MEKSIDSTNNEASQNQYGKHNMIIQMSGAPGSGKSTTAKLLAPLIDGVILDHDVIRSSLLEDDIPFYQAARAAYRLNWALAEALIQQGKSLIIDSPCNYQEVLDRGAALAQKYQYDYWYIECKSDNIEMLDQRIRNRLPLRSQRTSMYHAPTDAMVNHSSKDAASAPQKWMKIPCRPKENVITVESTGDLATRAKDLLEQMYPVKPKLS